MCVHYRQLSADERHLPSVVEALRDEAVAAVASLGDGAGWGDVAAVGLSQPGAIDSTTGRIAAAANFPWGPGAPVGWGYLRRGLHITIAITVYGYHSRLGLPAQRPTRQWPRFTRRCRVGRRRLPCPP